MKNINNKNFITFTTTAMNRMNFLFHNANTNVIAMRIGIKSGGCVGMKYYIEYAYLYEDTDEVVICGHIKVFISAKAMLYIIGSTIDYVDQKFHSGFVFTNPNVKFQCGCGSSFSV